jgi:putative transposase
MTSNEDFLNAKFLKQFKDSKEFASHMEELNGRGTGKILKIMIDQS